MGGGNNPHLKLCKRCQYTFKSKLHSCQEQKNCDKENINLQKNKALIKNNPKFLLDKKIHFNPFQNLKTLKNKDDKNDSK